MKTLAKVTADDCVRAAQAIRTACSAQQIAERLGTSPRAVATAIRSAVKDGRVSIRFPKGLNMALYRFVRVKAKPQ